jgi:hypothetical protein
MNAEDKMTRVLRKLLWIAAVLIALVILAVTAKAHDHTRPELNDWLKSLHSQNKTWCCDGSDTDAIEDWETRGNRYRVKFRGQWFDVPSDALVDGPNNGGEALLWMNKGFSGLAVRCFKPGSMT